MIFDSSLLTQVILPFLLIFVVIFAILQKSKILGEGKAQIDALVSLAIALILIGVPRAREIVVELMPWLAVAISVILVFLILYGFVAGDLSSNVPKWMKIVFGILACLFTLGLVIYVTGVGESLKNWFSGNSGIWSTIILILVIGGAFAVAVSTGKKGGSSE